ncbi:hypothetical protein D3C76_1850420 [compost metagenome]
MAIATLLRSTFTTRVLETGLPMALLPATVTFIWPAGQLLTSAADTLVSQLPSASTLAL